MFKLLLLFCFPCKLCCQLKGVNSFKFSKNKEQNLTVIFLISFLPFQPFNSQITDICNITKLVN